MLPDTWPVPVADTHALVGYAGGLGPETVAKVLPQLTQATPFWIDMESKIRNGDDRFDVGLCRRVCEAVYGQPAVRAAE